MNVAAILILLGGQLCVDPTAWDCHPKGRGFSMDWIGFSTEGEPCQGESGEPALALSISASPTDPHANQGSIPGDDLYLWLTESSAGTAYGFASVHVVFSGSIDVVGYQHVAPGSPNWDGGNQSLLFWLPCVDSVDDTLVGILQTGTAVSADEDDSASWGRIKTLYR